MVLGRNEMPLLKYIYLQGMGPLLTGLFAHGILKLVVLPMEDSFAEGLEKMLPGLVRPYYDPVIDRTYTIMALSGLSAYVVVAMGFCTLLDLFPSVTMAHKVQGHRNYFTLPQWLQAVGVGLINLLCFSWFATLPCWVLQRDGYLRGGTPATAVEAEFDLPTAMLHFAIHGIVIDVWFYGTHRLIHCPILYRWIHKFHHRFKAPTAVACVYANPLEFIVGNVGGVVLGPALTNCHPYSAAFWMAYAITSTSFSHSGYTVFGATSHDQHHEHFDFNFGVLITDAVLGTKFEGSARQKRILAEAAAKRQEAKSVQSTFKEKTT